MELLLVLRVLTLVVRVLLAGGLLVLVVTRRPVLGRASWSAWLIVTVVNLAILVDSSLIELLQASWELVSLPRELLLLFYPLAYLFNAALDAALPFGLLAVLPERVCWRRRALPVLVLVAAVSIVGWSRGAATSWDTLLNTTRILSFLGIGGYLTCLGLRIVGRLPRLDIYLAGLLAIEMVFALLLPIQEVFFQNLGQEAAAQVWDLLQFLQLVAATAQFAIVLALLNAVRVDEGRRVIAVPEVFLADRSG